MIEYDVLYAKGDNGKLLEYMVLRPKIQICDRKED
jgi:hypothetical protein